MSSASSSKAGSKPLLKPIVLIPGVCGSKLQSENLITKEKTTCWLHASLDSESYVQQYLWTKYDESSKSQMNRLHEYEKIKAIEGLNGCDYLIDNDFIRGLGKKYESFSFASYYQKIQTELERYGYVANENLFGFSFDWRISTANDQLQQDFSKLIDHIYNLTKQKIILIGHSMGGLVADAYIRKNKTAHEKICNFIAISVPFGGSSVVANAVYTYGYNLSMPISQCTSKGLGTSCSSITGLQTPQPYSTSPIFSQIFVKKPKNKENVVLEETQIDTKYNIIQLNDDIYKGRTPDICYVMAKDIYQKKLVKYQIISSFTMLQKCCIPGAIFIYGKTNKQQEIINDVFEKKFSEWSSEKLAKIRSIKQQDWEIYQSFAKSRNIQYQSNDYCEIVGNTIKFTADFQEQLNYQHDIKQTNFYNLHDFIVAKQYFYQHSSYFTNALDYKVQCGGPWQLPLQHLQLDSVKQSLFDLHQKMHAENTIDRYMYPYSQQLEIQIKQELKYDELDVFKLKNNFHFLNISGYGRMTPLHMVYYQDVENYMDFLNQKPLFIMGDGDGTVLTTCAMDDGYPERLVDDRILLFDCEHFAIVREDRLVQILVEYLELKL